MNVSWGHQKIDAAEVKLRGELRGFRKLKKKKRQSMLLKHKEGTEKDGENHSGGSPHPKFYGSL